MLHTYRMGCESRQLGSLAERSLTAATFIMSLLTSSVVMALSTGNSFQKFSPNASGIDFIATESSYPVKEGQLVMSTYLDYAMFVMPVIYESGIVDETSQDTLLSSHNHLSFGMSQNLELQLKFPFMLLAQSLDHPSDKGAIIGSGFSYIGGGLKYRLFKHTLYEMAAGGEIGFDLMKSNPYIGDGVIPFGAFGYIAITADYKPIILGINLGYRWRTTGTPILHQEDLPPAIQPVAHKLLFSSALSISSGVFGYFMGEVYGSHAFVTDYERLNQTDRAQTSLEYLLGFNKFFKSGVGIKFGGGSQIFHGIGTSSLRIIAGIDYAFDAKKAGWISPPKRGTPSPSQEGSRQPQLPPDPFGDENSYEDEDHPPSMSYPGAQGSEDVFDDENMIEEDWGDE